MDMIKEELEHTIEDQEDQQPPLRQGHLTVAQTREEDRDLDDPDFAGRKEAFAEKESQEEPGQAAAEKILRAQ